MKNVLSLNSKIKINNCEWMNKHPLAFTLLIHIGMNTQLNVDEFDFKKCTFDLGQYCDDYNYNKQLLTLALEKLLELGELRIERVFGASIYLLVWGNKSIQIFEPVNCSID